MFSDILAGKKITFPLFIYFLMTSWVVQGHGVSGFPGHFERGMTMAIVRFIKIGKKTEGHEELLKAKGYEVTRNEDVLQVTCTAVREGTMDLSTPEKAAEILREVVTKKEVFSYETKFQFADGKVLFGVMACSRLGKASALITKGEAKKAKVSQLDDIFAAL